MPAPITATVILIWNDDTYVYIKLRVLEDNFVGLTDYTASVLKTAYDAEPTAGAKKALLMSTVLDVRTAELAAAGTLIDDGGDEVPI